MKRYRDLAWITDHTGALVGVIVVHIDAVSCRIEYECDPVVPPGGELHVPGVTRPALASRT